MKCHDQENMGSNPGQVKLEVRIHSNTVGETSTINTSRSLEPKMKKEDSKWYINDHCHGSVEILEGSVVKTSNAEALQILHITLTLGM